MAAIQEELYDVFISAGAEEPKARAAARSVAKITTDYPKPEELATKEYIDKRITEVKAELKIEMASLEARLMRALWLHAASIIVVVISINVLPV